jgi:hypothetical protein
MRDPLQFLKQNETVSHDEREHSAMNTRIHMSKPTLQRFSSALQGPQGVGVTRGAVA